MGIPYDTWCKLVERVHPDMAAVHPEAPERREKPSSHERYGIVIQCWHPTKLNRLIGCHWATKARLIARDLDIIACVATRAHIPRATGPRRVRLTIVLGPGQRAGDVDAYWKSVLDALVHCGLLIDDNRQHVTLDPVEFVRGNVPATTIELEDI